MLSLLGLVLSLKEFIRISGDLVEPDPLLDVVFIGVLMLPDLFLDTILLLLSFSLSKNLSLFLGKILA